MKQTKASTYKSNDDDKPPTIKEVYNEILKEKIDEILKMSKEIGHNDLAYDFKGPTVSINFGKFEVHCIFMVTWKIVKKYYSKYRNSKKNLKWFKRNNIRKSKA